MANSFRTHLATLIISATCGALPRAHAQDTAATQKVVDIRQSVFTLISWNFSPTIGPMMAGKLKYDPAVVQKNVARLEALAPMIPDAFAADTHGVSGIKTRAKEGIWANMADFRAKDEDLVKAVARLSGVAKSSDEEAFRQAATAVSQACRACHDSYRTD